MVKNHLTVKGLYGSPAEMPEAQKVPPSWMSKSFLYENPYNRKGIVRMAGL